MSTTKIEGTLKSIPRQNNTDASMNEDRFNIGIYWEGANITYKITDPTEADFDDNSGNNIYCFSPDPVHITCDRQDLTQLIMISQCQIKMYVNKDHTKDLYAHTNREKSVQITRLTSPEVSSNTVVFFGYVDPLSFDQGIAHAYEEITVTATDPLGALNQLTIYDLTAINQQAQLKLLDFIHIICEACFKKDSSKFAGIKTFFPNAIDPNSIMINVGQFYGDSIDDGKTLYDLLTEILKYLGCTLCYEPQSKKIILNCLYNTDNLGGMTAWFDGTKNTLDGRAAMSMDDVYNQVNLTCTIEETEDEIKLLEDDELYSDYKQMQKCMTELISSGEGMDALNGFGELLNSADEHERSAEYDSAERVEHFCYVKRNDAWNFGKGSYIEYMGGKEGNRETGEGFEDMEGDQSEVLRWLKLNPFKGAFIAFGKGDKIKLKDNSPVNNISLTDYLVISVNGHNDQRKNGHADTLYQKLQQNVAICSYEGIKSMNLVPTDKTITNYIVISGKIILNPLQAKTGPNWTEDLHDSSMGELPDTMPNMYTASTNTFTGCKTAFSQTERGMPLLWHKTVRYNDANDGAYYQIKNWKLATGASELKPSYTRTDEQGILPFLSNTKNEMLEYTYTEIGDNNDKISKLPILICQIKVGDYWCVERFDKNNEGGIFEWLTMDEWKATPLNTSMHLLQPYFTIGIDPKMNEKMVGKAYSIQNNINYTMNIDTSGTAIPITIDDKLNGVAEFKILGPVMAEWNQIERIHPSFWRHTKWNDHKVWVLELLDSIMISDLKIEFKSDNGKYNEAYTNEDSDLVYYSAMNPDYPEKLEIESLICTPLKLDECVALGVKYKISNSYVMTADNNPFYGWTYGNSKIKPEHLLIDYYYKQCCKPARILDMKINGGWIIGLPCAQNEEERVSVSSILTKYIIDMEYPGIVTDTVDQISGNYIDNYYCMGIDWSLRQKSTQCKFRQRLAYESPL